MPPRDTTPKAPETKPAELETPSPVKADAKEHAVKLEQRAVEAEAKVAELQAQVDELRASADRAVAEAKAAEGLTVSKARKGSKLTLIAVRRVGVGPATDRPRQGGVHEPGTEFQAHDEDAFERLQRIGAALTPGDYKKFKLES